jgi:ABC-type Fe3+/spermidine/putrescine transport system ATPase subunit
MTSTTVDPGDAREILLSVSSVSKAYGPVRALDDVSLEIWRNEFFALLGPSGCGKTTLLRAIAGFEDLDGGSITIMSGEGPDAASDDLLALPPNKRPVNLMFQSYALFPHMSVRKNIAYGLEREGVARAEVAARVSEVLATVGLEDKASSRPAQLSGGQKQRVALARAIVKRPRLLLLDEPLSALDRKVRAEMQIELKRLQSEVGITFVVVTHDQEEAMSMADRIAVMDGGRVQQVADPVTLYGQPANVFVADFIGSGTLIPGVIDGAGLRALGRHIPIADTRGLAGAAVLMLRPEQVRLVDSGEIALLDGEVVETHFYGGSSTTSIRVAGLDNPVIASQPGAPVHLVGERVGITWDSSSSVLLAVGP